ncbi:MAG: pinensin family lanthipeptide [Melioribacteraceae bacterium]
MKKLKLNLDEIKVESFETNPIQLKTGTVLGNLMAGDTQPVDNCQGGGGGGGSIPFHSIGSPLEVAICLTETPVHLYTVIEATCPDTCAIWCFTNNCPPYSNLGNCTHNDLC